MFSILLNNNSNFILTSSLSNDIVKGIENEADNENAKEAEDEEELNEADNEGIDNDDDEEELEKSDDEEDDTEDLEPKENEDEEEVKGDEEEADDDGEEDDVEIGGETKETGGFVDDGKEELIKGLGGVELKGTGVVVDAKLKGGKSELERVILSVQLCVTG